MTEGQAQSPFLLEVEGLACGRGETVLARDLSFRLNQGSGVLLRGSNGVGKSTLLLTLAGLLPPIAGTVRFHGHDPESGPALHYCGHRNGIRPRLSVEDTLRFWAAINGPCGLAIGDALERVGLAGTARLDASYLSAGQQRRLALARLLVSPRKLWLLDEPTAALDSQGHGLVASLLAEHLDAGGLAIIATHDDIGLTRMTTLTLGAKP